MNTVDNQNSIETICVDFDQLSDREKFMVLVDHIYSAIEELTVGHSYFQKNFIYTPPRLIEFVEIEH